MTTLRPADNQRGPEDSSVYFLRVVGAAGPVKIGYSRFPSTRFSMFCGWSPVPLEIAAVLPNVPPETERRFHRMFADSWMHGEWFAASPRLTKVIADINAGRFDLSTIPECGPLKRRKTWTAQERQTRLLRIRCTRAMTTWMPSWDKTILEAYRALGGPDHDRAVEIIEEMLARKAAA